jgi:hypothetical protein
LRVRLWKGVQKISLVAVVDSGADSSLLDVSYADLLGLDRKKARKHKATGATGSPITCYHWPKEYLELEFRNKFFPFKGAFADFEAGVDGENLLGRADFFSQYIVEFWDAAQLMNIYLYPPFI